MQAPEAQGGRKEELLYGLGAAAGAVLLAGVFLYQRRITKPWFKRLEAMLNQAASRLNDLHSGNVADYVAWMVAAVAGFGAWLGFLIRNG
jgi:hypothetical protein